MGARGGVGSVRRSCACCARQGCLRPPARLSPVAARLPTRSQTTNNQTTKQPWQERGVSVEGRLLISDRAHMLFELHKEIDGAREAELAGTGKQVRAQAAAGAAGAAAAAAAEGP